MLSCGDDVFKIAVYGANDKFVDVTQQIKKAYSGKRITHLPHYNDLAGDPIVNVVKTLKVTFKYKDGTTKTAVFQENTPMVVPAN